VRPAEKDGEPFANPKGEPHPSGANRYERRDHDEWAQLQPIGGIAQFAIEAFHITTERGPSR